MKIFEPLKPKIVLGIAAHPDDLEFSIAGSIAKWTSEGTKAYYLILTDGSKGTEDRNAIPKEMTELRRQEQRDAGKIIGLSDVFFEDFEDGTLENSLELKKAICRIIRKVKPDVVLCMDPTFIYSADRGMINHTDHRAGAMATLDSVYPLARDHLSFPELLTEEKLEPHKVKTLLMTNFENHNFGVDVSAQVETKLKALAAHRSQIPDLEQRSNMLKQWMANTGSKYGCSYAEAFVRLDMSL
ncbi:MAG: PIG-L deacetylase family protein [Candidatus Saccharibacteria bacterium]|jgi:LmbE family N-acetylglucosaminyl deacetylase